MVCRNRRRSLESVKDPSGEAVAVATHVMAPPAPCRPRHRSRLSLVQRLRRADRRGRDRGAARLVAGRAAGSRRCQAGWTSPCTTPSGPPCWPSAVIRRPTRSRDLPRLVSVRAMAACHLAGPHNSWPPPTPCGVCQPPRASHNARNCFTELGRRVLPELRFGGPAMAGAG
jgi:hypothetical protein